MLANEIDNAQKVVLQKLNEIRATAPIREMEQRQVAGSEYFKVDDNGVMTLTANTNRPKIHEVLGGLFNDNNTKYLIDYS